MIFTSDVFLLLFLPVVFALYWLLRGVHRQNALLLAASYFFYGWWDYRFCALLWLGSTSDFLIARLMDRSSSDIVRKRLVIASCSINIGVLAFFKYCNFFLESASAVLSFLSLPVSDWSLRILLPLGISFHTFQTLSYVIDVYRRRMPACRNYLTYLTFIAFFPQLVAGPIERASHMLPQYERRRVFQPGRATIGLQLLLWGLIKKIAIADNLAPFADQVFSAPETFGQIHLAFGLLAFAIQIYCDFSGYSDMARGIGFLFDIELMRNFRTPYFSSSLTEFWRRWHISLSTWFRDYVYIPLGGNRVSPVKQFRNLMITFLTSGLWHGASWNFVLWGLIHGLLVWMESFAGRFAPRDGSTRAVAIAPFKVLMTLTIVVLTWIPFRAPTFAAAVEFARGLVLNHSGQGSFSGTMSLRGAALLIAGLLSVEFLSQREESPLCNLRLPTVVRWGVYTAAFWLLVMLVPARMPPFIYFQF